MGVRRTTACDIPDAVVEERLAGGRTAGAVRVGDTVRRPVRPWSKTVQDLLEHLDRSGFAAAPRPLGVDSQGRDVQSLLAGETVGLTVPWPSWVWSDSALVQVGAWLRALHDATAGYVPAPDAKWFAGQVWRAGLVIGHHDAAPYNAVWNDGNLAGFFDWDTAGPSSREFDLAYAALFWVPLHARDLAAHIGFFSFDDRRRRLHLLLDSYRLDSDRAAFSEIVLRRVSVNAETIRRLARTGDPIYTAMLPDAYQLDRAAAEIGALPADFWLRDD